MKRTLLIILASVITGIIGIVIIISLGDAKMKEVAENYPQTFIDTISKEYKDLLRYPEKADLYGSWKTDGRNPVTSIIYDKKYDIDIIKLNGKYPKPFDSIIIWSYNKEHITYDLIYYGTPAAPLELRYVAQTPVSSNLLRVILNGSELKTVSKNDSLIIIHSRLNNFSIKYSAGQPHELYINQHVNEDLPIEIILKKSGSDVYALFIMPKRDSGILPLDAYKTVLK